MKTVPVISALTMWDAFVRVEIVGWHDDHQPGFVECRLVDRFGRAWHVIEKEPVVSAAGLRPDSPYPQPGRMMCNLLKKGIDDEGRAWCAIELSVAGAQEDHYEVFADDIIPFTAEDLGG